jgi:hypothetical protein
MVKQKTGLPKVHFTRLGREQNSTTLSNSSGTKQVIERITRGGFTNRYVAQRMKRTRGCDEKTDIGKSCICYDDHF